MEQIALIEAGPFFEGRRSPMQMTRHRDEVAYCHAMGVNELRTHLARVIIPGDCAMCEWFGRFERVPVEKI